MAEPESIMVVTPHPDDSESAAGGTIAKWCAEGKKVTLVVCTNGDKGSSDRSVVPAELAELREKETLEAARVYGLAGVEFLRLPDQALDDTDFVEGLSEHYAGGHFGQGLADCLADERHCPGCARIGFDDKDLCAPHSPLHVHQADDV